MKRALPLFLLCLASLLAPSGAPAFPDTAARHAVDVKGVSWTVLRDHKDPLQWYYVPAVARQAEYGRNQPALALIKYQSPSPADKQQLQENAFLFLTLTLGPDADTLAALAKAVAALPARADQKAGQGAIRFAAAPLSGVKLSLLDDNGALLATAAPLEGLNPAVSAERLQFAVALPNFDQGMFDTLLNKAGGYGAAVDYKYLAAAFDRVEWRAAPPAAAAARAEGRIGLGAYPEDVRDKAVLILPPQSPDYALLALPPVGEDPGVAGVNYQVEVLAPDGKPSKCSKFNMAQWKPQASAEARAPGDTGWRDSKNNPLTFLYMPIKACLAEAAAAGKKIEDYKFQSSISLQAAAGRTVLLKKAALDTPLSGSVPVYLPSAYFTAVRLLPDFLAFEHKLDGQHLLLADFKIICGKAGYTGRFKKSDEVNPPFGAYFPRDCSPVRLEVNYIDRQGKRTARPPVADLLKEAGPAVYLADPD